VLTNAPNWMRMGAINELLKNVIAIVTFSADGYKLGDIEKTLCEAKRVNLEATFDFLLHSYRNVSEILERSFIRWFELSMGNESYDVSAISFHKMMQVSRKERRDEWVGFHYWAMPISLLSRIFNILYWYGWAKTHWLRKHRKRFNGYRFGKVEKGRVNTISQSPTNYCWHRKSEEFDSSIIYADH